MAVSTSRDGILLERRYAAVIAAISDESLAAMATAVEEKLRDPLARMLGLPAGSFDDPTTLGARIRESMKARKAHLDTGVVLGEAATNKAIDMLGDASDDPSLEDLQLVLPKLIEEFGLDAVRMMAIQYSIGLGGFRKLVATDERFQIPTNQGAGSTATPVAREQDAEKKRLRAERKQREKELRAKQRTKGN
jgi:hypothetical protein